MAVWNERINIGEFIKEFEKSKFNEYSYVEP